MLLSLPFDILKYIVNNYLDHLSLTLLNIVIKGTKNKQLWSDTINKIYPDIFKSFTTYENDIEINDDNPIYIYKENQYIVFCETYNCYKTKTFEIIYTYYTNCNEYIETKRYEPPNYIFSGSSVCQDNKIIYTAYNSINKSNIDILCFDMITKEIYKCYENLTGNIEFSNQFNNILLNNLMLCILVESADKFDVYLLDTETNKVEYVNPKLPTPKLSIPIYMTYKRESSFSDLFLYKDLTFCDNYTNMTLTYKHATPNYYVFNIDQNKKIVSVYFEHKWIAYVIVKNHNTFVKYILNNYCNGQHWHVLNDKYFCTYTIDNYKNNKISICIYSLETFQFIKLININSDSSFIRSYINFMCLTENKLIVIIVDEWYEVDFYIS